MGFRGGGGSYAKENGSMREKMRGEDRDGRGEGKRGEQ